MGLARTGSRAGAGGSCVDTPGSSRPEWKFILHDTQTADARLSVAHTGEAPSSILLPIIPDVAVPTALAPCPSLRGQPCREFVDFANTPAEMTPEEIEIMKSTPLGAPA